jgi:integrase
VPLSAPAIEVLRKLEKVRTNDFVFPGQTEGTPISNAAMMAVLRRIAMAEAKARGEETHIRVAASGRKSTKLKRLYFKPDVTVHGFRSTFRDWAGEETDFPREVCEAALSHAIGDETEEAYRRGDALKKRRQLMDAWAKYLF